MLKRGIFVVAAFAASVLASVQPAHADQFRFSLNDVRIERQREADGDRPYFTALTFRVRFCRSRLQPTVTVMEREPHDWVAFSEHTRGRNVGAHMSRGQTLPVPTWMGEATFNNVNMIRARGADGNWTDLTQAELIGVVYFSFDNNNTPPHVIRGLMNDAAGILRTVLQEEISDSAGCVRLLAGVRGGDTTEFSNRLSARLEEIARSTINEWQAVGLLAQLTVGSTFNPDQPTGVNLILVPTIYGLDPIQSGPPTRFNLPGGQMFAHTRVIQPASSEARLTFEGSGALYHSNFAFTHTSANATPATSTNATQVRLRVRTGGDDLRGGNDNVFAAVRINGTWRPEVQLNRANVRWADHSNEDIMIPIGTTPVSQIEAVRLRTTSGGGLGGDNWDMESIQIDWRGMGGIGGALGAGGPKRFTGNDRELVIEFAR